MCTCTSEQNIHSLWYNYINQVDEGQQVHGQSDQKTAVNKNLQQRALSLVPAAPWLILAWTLLSERSEDNEKCSNYAWLEQKCQCNKGEYTNHWQWAHLLLIVERRLDHHWTRGNRHLCSVDHSLVTSADLVQVICNRSWANPFSQNNPVHQGKACIA